MGPVALKSRPTRSGRRWSAGSDRVVRHWLAAALGALDAVRAHQALDRAARDRFAGPSERDPHASGPIGVVVGGMQLADAAEQALILKLSPGSLTGVALVVGGRRHAQGPADRLDA